MDQVVFNARKRADIGSRATARLRKQGRVPAVMYGRSGESLSVDLDASEFARGVKSISESTIVNLDVEGAPHQAFVKDTQYDIISGKVLHVDFYEVEKNKLLRAKVPLHIIGSSVGVRDGGILENPLHEIEVECLPANLPERIDVDISELKANQSIHVSDLSLASSVKVLSPAEQVIVLVKYAKAESEPASEAVAAPAAPAAPAAAKA